MVDNIGSTSGQINELVQKMNQLSIPKTEKPVPSSFLHKESVCIQDPVKPVDKFPFLFPKEIASQEPEKVETSSEHISIANLCLYMSLWKRKKSQNLCLYMSLWKVSTAGIQHLISEEKANCLKPTLSSLILIGNEL